jgi:hypothetical protein
MIEFVTKESKEVEKANGFGFVFSELGLNAQKVVAKRHSCESCGKDSKCRNGR